MPQYFFRIAFKGTRYHGWQEQKNAHTVQGEVNRGLVHILGLEEANTLGCGRTDTGVHASDFYFSLSTHDELDRSALRYKMNSYLSRDIAVRSIHPVPDEAHVRFDPVHRSYEYHIHLRKDPFLDGLSHYMRRPLDLEAMKEGARVLPEYEHFGAFARSKGNNRTDVCRLDRVEWEEWQKGERLIFHIRADRFLRGMVRGIVGTLLDLGSGRYGVKRFREIIESRDRTRAGGNAPPQGLYLSEVEYPYETPS